jgi:DNA-binding transcriptional LysR family regulator
MVVVLPDDHPLVSRQPAGTALRLDQLHDQLWISLTAGRAAREQLQQAAADAGFTPDVRVETESYDVAQALVGTGIGVALISRLALTHAPGTTHRELARHHRQLGRSPARLFRLPDSRRDLPLTARARTLTTTTQLDIMCIIGALIEPVRAGGHPADVRLARSLAERMAGLG